MRLTEIQILVIEEKLKHTGLTYRPLYDELLDHICCLVEESLDTGDSFEIALNHALEVLSPEVIKKCQKDTKYLLNRNQILMKRITIAVCGMATSCFLITTVIFAQNIPSVMPLGDYEITSPFGKRADPISKEFKYHFGIDLKAPTGTPVLATADGKVIRVEEQPEGYGKFVVIEHDNNYQTRYAQLSEFKVSIGIRVIKGNVIGLVGSSGRSTAPHLHYEVILEGKRIDPISTIEDS